MFSKKKIFSYLYPFLKFKNQFYQYIKINNNIRVLIYHNIDEENENQFVKQIEWLKNSWNIITPDYFSEIMIHFWTSALQRFWGAVLHFLTTCILFPGAFLQE